MTNLNIEQVQEARKTGTQFVFNMSACQAAVAATPRTAKSGAHSGGVGVQAILKMIVEAIGHPIDAGQAMAAWNSQEGLAKKTDRKYFSDQLWYTAKAGKILKMGDGTYAPLGYNGAGTVSVADEGDTADEGESQESQVSEALAALDEDLA